MVELSKKAARPLMPFPDGKSTLVCMSPRDIFKETL